uniref:Cupin type-1 domain-containing protein n=1 Tax=Aegilops tauschii subsp. strangulata TaxID=200361 RepID=A0A453LKK6_AEGTS
MSAKGGKAQVQSDAGAYVAWSGVDQPELAAEGLGCGLLVLRPLSFALPHYADSHKFGYVLGGSGVAGVLPVATGDASPAARERVVRLEAGDVIAVRTGDVSWWYNDSDGDADDLSILFMGDTERAVNPGDISYFFLAGGNSVLGGFDAGLLEPASRPPHRAEHEAARRLPARARQKRARRERRTSRCRDPGDARRGGPGGARGPRNQHGDRPARSRHRAHAVGVTGGCGAVGVRGTRERARSGVFFRGRRDAAAGRGGRRGECVRRTAVRRDAHLRRRRRRRVGVPDQERQARGGAPDRGWLDARRPDRAGGAGVAERGAGVGGAARSPQRRAVAL